MRNAPLKRVFCSLDRKPTSALKHNAFLVQAQLSWGFPSRINKVVLRSHKREYFKAAAVLSQQRHSSPPHTFLMWTWSRWKVCRTSYQVRHNALRADTTALVFACIMRRLNVSARQNIQRKGCKCIIRQVLLDLLRPLLFQQSLTWALQHYHPLKVCNDVHIRSLPQERFPTKAQLRPWML